MEISVEARPQYLFVVVTGVFELQLALDLLNKVLGESVRRRLLKILIDYRELQGVPPAMTEDFIYAASGAMSVQDYAKIDGKLPRIAYLAPKSVLEDGDFGAEVAALFGFPDAKRTTSVEEALEWLRLEDN
jgi:hypothetical protein